MKKAACGRKIKDFQSKQIRECHNLSTTIDFDLQTNAKKENSMSSRFLRERDDTGKSRWVNSMFDKKGVR